MGLLMLLLLLLQHVLLLQVLSGLPWFFVWGTSLVAGRLAALLLTLLTATLVPVGDRLGDRTCGGRGGEGVWLWWSHPTCRNFRSLALGFFARAILVSLIFHLKDYSCRYRSY